MTTLMQATRALEQKQREDTAMLLDLASKTVDTAAKVLGAARTLGDDDDVLAALDHLHEVSVLIEKAVNR